MELDKLDLLDIRSALSEEECLTQDTVARFVDDSVLPIITECFNESRFPTELVPELARLGLLGANLEYAGCEGLNNVCYGLLCQEDGNPLDDVLVYKGEEDVFMVVNAANHDRDLAWLREQCAGMEVTIEDQTAN